MHSLRILTARGLPALAAAFIALSASAPRAQTPFMASDFEERIAANKLSLSSQWAFLSDFDSHGNSVITSGDTSVSPALIDTTSFASPGYGGSQYCFKLAYVFGNVRPHGDGTDTSTYDPEVGMETQIYNESLSLGADFTGATKITFYAKAEKAGKIRFAVSTPEVADYAYWGTDFSITTAWKQYTMDFGAKAFAQPEWRSVAVPFNIKAVTGFILVISQAFNPGAGGAFYMDDLAITGWKPKELEVPTAIQAVSSAPSVSGRMGMAFSSDGRSARIRLDAGYHNAQGTVEVFGVSGRLCGSAGFGKGADDISVPLTGAARDRGLLFYRVRAIASR
jgi:hypothetical protein